MSMVNGTETVTPATGARTRYIPKVLRATEMAGWKVRNPAGEDLGKIEELMIDVMAGRIAYAVLSFGGILGMGDKLFAVPWEALTVRPADEIFILDVPKERLENAPGFDKDEWPMTGDREWRPEEEETWMRPPSMMPYRARRIEEERVVTTRTEPARGTTVVAPAVVGKREETREDIIGGKPSVRGGEPEKTYKTSMEAGRAREGDIPPEDSHGWAKETLRKGGDPCMYDRTRASKEYNCDWLEGMFTHFGYRPYWYDYQR
jgi:sporulation protein YlmC with PRC-barrel domain